MNTLLLNVKNEFYKLIVKKKYIVIMILGILICSGRLGMSMLIARLSHSEITIKSNIILEMLIFCTDILTPLVVFIAATDLFASEIQDDTIKAALMCPASRFKVLTSKAIAVFLLGSVYFAATFISCTLMQLISGTGAPFFRSALAYAADLIPMFSLVLMAVLINLISRSPSLAMLMCIGVYVLFKYANYYVSPIGQMLFTAYTRWHTLWLGTALPPGALLSKLGILFGSMLVMYAVSYMIFERKDF